MNTLLVILGPTASGKSELAIKLAKKNNGEVISADSRQVYRGMDLGTGKVPRDKISGKSDFLKEVGLPYIHQGIPHYLLDVASPKRRFTAAQYKKLAKQAIAKIQQKNKLPILCGGTGFYIQAVVDNLGLPEVKPDANLRAQLEKKTTIELYQQLKKLDIRRARNIDRNNRRRLIRALEIIIKTGKPVPLLSSQIPIPSYKMPPPSSRTCFGISGKMLKQACPEEMLKQACPEEMLKQVQHDTFGVQHDTFGVQHDTFGVQYDNFGVQYDNFGVQYDNQNNILQIGIKIAPDELKKRIKIRLQKRLKTGMIEEVKKLKKAGLSWKRLEDFGLEYRFVAQYLQGKITGKEMKEKIQKASEQYARRQMTWFKRDQRIHWISNFREAEKLVKEFL